MLRILDQAEAAPFLNRASRRLDDALEIVKPIVQAVRDRGDVAVREYAEKLDGFTGESFIVESCGELEPTLLEAVTIAAKNIRDFAQQQLVKPWQTTTSDGRTLGQLVRPLDSVGVYVPAGRYPLLSTMLMPVEMSYLPVPSISKVAEMLVSLLTRLTVGFLISLFPFLL